MRIDAEKKIVSYLQPLSPWSVCFNSRFSGLVRFVLRFDRNYNAKLEGAEIDDDEGLEDAFEVVVEVLEV